MLVGVLIAGTVAILIVLAAKGLIAAVIVLAVMVVPVAHRRRRRMFSRRRLSSSRMRLSTTACGSSSARLETSTSTINFGYRPPSWYDWLKNETEPVVADPRAMADVAARAGFADVRLNTLTVPTGLASAAELVSWRLGMATVAPFLARLSQESLSGLRVEAERAVAAAGCPPLTASLLVLTAR